MVTHAIYNDEQMQVLSQTKPLSFFIPNPSLCCSCLSHVQEEKRRYDLPVHKGHLKLCYPAHMKTYMFMALSNIDTKVTILSGIVGERGSQVNCWDWTRFEVGTGDRIDLVPGHLCQFIVLVSTVLLTSNCY